jgi:hypothetical protein
MIDVLLFLLFAVCLLNFLDFVPKIGLDFYLTARMVASAKSARLFQRILKRVGCLVRTAAAESRSGISLF